MARPVGFEPTTVRLEGGRSIQLSYGRIVAKIMAPEMMWTDKLAAASYPQPRPHGKGNCGGLSE